MIRSYLPSKIVRNQLIAASRSVSHFQNLPLAPPDKILGLNEAFKNDKSPNKVNLGVGAYRDDNGKPFILQSVREAERRVFERNLDHEYAGIAGLQSFIDRSIEFAYGKNAQVIADKRVAAIQTLSGTGACRVMGEFVVKLLGDNTKVYYPEPTWGNHLAIIKNSRAQPVPYRYFNPKTCSINFDGMLEDIAKAEKQSVFMLHACAHNPTGCDPTPAQWDKISEAIKARNHLVFLDCAYQGFASGDSERDAYAIRKFVEDGHNIILAQSFAKNFGLYGERIGALSVVTASAEETERVNSQLKLLARPMYSNPPVYGARIVAEILSDNELRTKWTTECKGMADRIGDMRTALRSALQQIGSKRDWSHVTTQIGMFCFTGLSTDQVLRLRNDFHIYCTEDGRISMAGVTSKNVNYIAQAIHEVSK